MSSFGNLMWLLLGSGEPKLIYTQYGPNKEEGAHMGRPEMSMRADQPQMGRPRGDHAVSSRQ